MSKVQKKTLRWWQWYERYYIGKSVGALLLAAGAGAVAYAVINWNKLENMMKFPRPGVYAFGPLPPIIGGILSVGGVIQRGSVTSLCETLTC